MSLTAEYKRHAISHNNNNNNNSKDNDTNNKRVQYCAQLHGGGSPIAACVVVIVISRRFLISFAEPARRRFGNAGDAYGNRKIVQYSSLGRRDVVVVSCSSRELF